MFCRELESLALLVASLCHDVDHRGTTNSFQLASNSVLAALYSSEGSVMEVLLTELILEAFHVPRENPKQNEARGPIVSFVVCFFFYGNAEDGALEASGDDVNLSTSSMCCSKGGGESNRELKKKIIKKKKECRRKRSSGVFY